MKEIDSKIYGLSTRVKLVRLGDNHLAIVKKIKSRIIMKDGQKILKQVKQIRSKEHNTRVSLIISAPICSKTRIFLYQHNIDLFERGNYLIKPTSF